MTRIILTRVKRLRIEKRTEVMVKRRAIRTEELSSMAAVKLLRKRIRTENDGKRKRLSTVVN